MDTDTDIDIYLLSFEKICRQYHLPQNQWPKYLTPGLRGKALDAYVDMPSEPEPNYETIKEAIVRKYQLTPDVYRKRFRALHKLPTDSYMDVASRLRTTFRQWTKGLKKESFEDLEDLMIQDQFLHICPPEIRQFVLERKPESSTAAADLADTYVHTRVSDHRRAPPNGVRGGRSSGATSATSVSQPSSKPAEGVSGAKPVLMEPRKCYTCGQPGHLKYQCPETKKRPSSDQAVSNSSSVLFVSEKSGGSLTNLQPVVIGNRTVTGFRDTGAEVTLIRPELIEEGDLIPEKFLTLTGVGGTRSRVPRARVFIDWGAGSGMREVGVSDEIPTPVLLGADLGTLISYYAPAEDTPDSSPELSESTKVLCTDVGLPSGHLGGGQRGEEGGVEVECSPRDGEEIVTQQNVPDTCVSNGVTVDMRKVHDIDVNVDDLHANVNCDGKDILPILVVTHSAARAARSQPLVLETEEEILHVPLCSDPMDVQEPQQSCLFATGKLAGTCSAACATALQTDTMVEQLRSLADKPPAEGDQSQISWLSQLPPRVGENHTLALEKGYKSLSCSESVNSVSGTCGATTSITLQTSAQLISLAACPTAGSDRQQIDCDHWSLDKKVLHTVVDEVKEIDPLLASVAEMREENSGLTSKAHYESPAPGLLVCSKFESEDADLRSDLLAETGKAEAIVAWPTPQTKKLFMSFLGKAGYYRKFVPNYSSLAKSLADVVKKKWPKMVSWDSGCKRTFRALKQALSSAAVLQALDFTRWFFMQTDAFMCGRGAFLSPIDQAGEVHLIHYLSRKLLPREVAYATIEKECLAIVWALQKLQHFLYGRSFTIITDHNPLSWLSRISGENGKLLRWSLILQQYTFCIQHKKGSCHGNADGLSRRLEPVEVASEWDL